MASDANRAEIERVARALHQVLAGSDPDEMIHHPAQSSWEKPSQRRWEQWVEAAEAAIAARAESQPELLIIRELQNIRVGMLDHYQAATILERLVKKAQECSAISRAEGLPSRLEKEFGQTHGEKSSAGLQESQPMRSVSGEGKQP